MLQTWSEPGKKGLLARSVDVFRRQRPIDQFYPKWIRRYDTLTKRMRDGMRREMAEWPAQPLISVIMSVHNPDPRGLEAAVGAVRAQVYPCWELCICDDASTLAGVRETLSSIAQANGKIRLRLRENSGGVCAA